MWEVAPQHWWLDLRPFALDHTIQSPGCHTAEAMSLSPSSVSSHRGTLDTQLTFPEGYIILHLCTGPEFLPILHLSVTTGCGGLAHTK